ncbi:MAG TPA: amidohydrolase family protein [Chloroflexota bacterium]|nr:amidohydrolase family protein [Chloroflexota bacterium]
MAAPLVDVHTHLSLAAPEHYPQAMHHVDALLHLQREHGISRSAVYSPMVVSQAMKAGHDPLEAARRYNDFIARTRDEHPDEVTGVGIIYPFASDESAREAERAVRELGLSGIMANPYLKGDWLDQDDRAEPLFQAMESLGVPLIVHPEEFMEVVVAEAVGRRLLFDEGLVLWRTLATTWALYGFATGPLLDRFPRLKLVFAHGGGLFWGKAARIDMAFRELVARGDAIAASQWEGPSSDTLPFDRLRSHEVYMDTAWMDRGSMRNAIEWLGPDRVLFGTDGSPHPGSIDYFKRQLADMGLPDAQRQAIEHTNAARLFGFQS